MATTCTNADCKQISPDLALRPLGRCLVDTRSHIRLELLVPLTDNSGTPFVDSTFSAFEDLLVDIAGGFTCRFDVEGAWRAPDGRIVRDRLRSYFISVPETVADRTVSLLDTEVRRRFRQEATFLEATSTRAVAF